MRRRRAVPNIIEISSAPPAAAVGGTVVGTHDVPYGYIDAAPSQQYGLPSQQRQERLEELAHVFACIFAALSPEQQAKYMPEDALREAA